MPDQLAGNSWFSSLDLKNGYLQVKFHPGNKEKTAFSIGKGCGNLLLCLLDFVMLLPLLNDGWRRCYSSCYIRFV